MIQQVAFLIVLLVAGFIIRRRILFIRSNIRLGKTNSPADRPAERWKNVLLVMEEKGPSNPPRSYFDKVDISAP